MIFDYPVPRLDRKHGPEGYSAYESYRPWLRDEFVFRCVYCLKREMWGQVTAEFELDHFQPQSLVPARALNYLNLVYACRRCNSVKQDQAIADPLILLSSKTVCVMIDGTIVSTSLDSKRLIAQMDLNSPALCRWRVMWMRIVELAKQRDTFLYQQITGFPPDLPNLGVLRPPLNSRPEGLASSWYTMQKKGELPEEY